MSKAWPWHKDVLPERGRTSCLLEDLPALRSEKRVSKDLSQKGVGQAALRQTGRDQKDGQDPEFSLCARHVLPCHSHNTCKETAITAIAQWPEDR